GERTPEPMGRIDGDAPLIFISHARKNSSAVDVIEKVLLLWRLRPWVDRQQLQGGQQWTAELAQAIADCTLLLLVLTPDALASEMVRREYQRALDLVDPVC